jgi:hypothetical protein
MQTPFAHLSPVVQSLPSSHAVPLGFGSPAQLPLGWQTQLVMHWSHCWHDCCAPTPRTTSSVAMATTITIG